MDQWKLSQSAKLSRVDANIPRTLASDPMSRRAGDVVGRSREGRHSDCLALLSESICCGARRQAIATTDRGVEYRTYRRGKAWICSSHFPGKYLIVWDCLGQYRRSLSTTRWGGEQGVAGGHTSHLSAERSSDSSHDRERHSSSTTSESYQTSWDTVFDRGDFKLYGGGCLPL